MPDAWRRPAIRHQRKEPATSVDAVTHLNFQGDARAAFEFYRSVFGGDLAVVTYEDAGNVQEPSEANQVMWGQVAADGGFRVMAYGVPLSKPWSPGEGTFFISLRGDSAEEITGYWESLPDGADVVVPPAPAQWAPLYGMLKDRFGVVSWVVDVVGEYSAS